MTDGGRLSDPGQGTTKASAAQRRSARGPVSARRVQADDAAVIEPPEPEELAGDDVGDVRRGDPPVAPRALPDPGQDSTQRR